VPYRLAHQQMVVCVAMLLAAGRLDFHKALYKCAQCGAQRWQGWAELLRLGYFPMSLHANCETFVEICLMERIRQEMRYQSPTGWGSRAESISAVGARLFNQVSRVLLLLAL